MTDLKTLREVAEAATPGPWRVRTNRHKTTSGEEWGWVSNMTTQNISLPGMSINWEAPAGHANATHIAVFNPVLVLSLLDRVEALEGALQQIATGEGIYGMQALEYKRIALAALKDRPNDR